MDAPWWLKKAAVVAVREVTPGFVLDTVGDVGEAVECGETLAHILNPRNVRADAARVVRGLHRVHDHTRAVRRAYRVLRGGRGPR